jgi:hypothetical protein
MENTMTLHRQSRSTDYGLATVALAASLMIAAPLGAASAAAVGGAGVGDGVGASAAAGPSSAANGSGYNPSETDCVNAAQQPGRYAPDDLSACGITAPIGGYGYYQPRG